MRGHPLAWTATGFVLGQFSGVLGRIVAHASLLPNAMVLAAVVGGWLYFRRRPA